MTSKLTKLLNANAPEVELYKHCYYLVQSGVPKELIIDTCFQFNETHDHDNEYYGVVDNVMTTINEWVIPPHTMLDYYMPSFNISAMEPAGATREERKAAREDKRKQRNDPVLNISFSEAVDYVNFEESTNALKGPYIRVPDYVCDKDFTDEDFDKWVMSL